MAFGEIIALKSAYTPFANPILKKLIGKILAEPTLSVIYKINAAGVIGADKRDYLKN